MFASKKYDKVSHSKKKITLKSPLALGVTLKSLPKRLTLIVRRKEPDAKSWDTKKHTNDELIGKTLMLKFHVEQYYGENPTAKSQQ